MNTIIGSSIPIRDAKAKVKGELKYASDLKLNNMAYGHLVLSTIAHGKVIKI